MTTKSFREMFPIFQRQVHGQPLTYLDSASTTQKPEIVIAAEADFYRQHNANVHRGVYALSEEATAAYEASRKTVAGFLNARLPREVIFTKSTTESINAVATAWARPRLQAGDEILLTEMEHHSNIVPWQQAAGATGAAVRYATITPDGRLDEKDFNRQLTPRTKIVALSAMSNVLGTINPIKQLIKIVRTAVPGARVVVDAAQAVAHVPVDVQSWDADFVAFSGHKLYGPFGIGVLYGKEKLLTEMEPFLFGGEMILEVTKAGATWNELPYKFEGGTSNVAGSVALGEAIRWLQSIGWEAIQSHEAELTAYALEKLQAESDVTLFGPLTTKDRGGVISFNLGALHPHDVASVLDTDGVAIRSGHHCAQVLMEVLKIPASCRISFGVYNSMADVDRLIAGLAKAKKILQ